MYNRIKIQFVLHNRTQYICSLNGRRLKTVSTAKDGNSKQKLMIAGGVLFLLATVSISAVYLPFFAEKVKIESIKLPHIYTTVLNSSQFVLYLLLIRLLFQVA